jgi:NAD(P)H-nitrite reductase large subunit
MPVEVVSFLQVPQQAIPQKMEGVYAIVPNTPGGFIDAKTLRRVAEVAEKYRVTVKLTNAQRIALVGFDRITLGRASFELGVPLARASGPFVRSVKACPGSTACSKALQDTIHLAKELDRRFGGWELPSKFKMAVSGCPNSCAESAVVDFGVIGLRYGFRVLVGGTAGAKPRLADELARVRNSEEVLELAERVIATYRRLAKKGERLPRLIERLGIKAFKKEVVG